MSRERIEQELALLREGGLEVAYIVSPRECVLFRAVPTAGTRSGLPATTDVVVPVPAGYPAAMIDLAGLPVGSPLLAHLRGGQNSQGVMEADGRQWQLASYHPHNGGGGPSWNQMEHGFHTYLGHLLSWLACLP
jgi:Prokaryotic E2 family E